MTALKLGELLYNARKFMGYGTADFKDIGEKWQNYYVAMAVKFLKDLDEANKKEQARS